MLKLPQLLYKSIRFKVMALVFLVIVLLMASVLCLSYVHEKKHINEDVNKYFTLAADIISDDIKRWLNNRKYEVYTLAANPLLHQYVNQWVMGEDYRQTEAELAEYWKRIVSQGNIFEEIYFTDPEGRIWLSSEQSRQNTYRPVDDLINIPLQTGEIYFSNAYKSTYTNQPSVAFALPLEAKTAADESTDRYVGVLVFRINIASVIQPLLSYQLKMGETGEFILIDQNRTAITDLRARPNSALQYQLQSQPAFKVVNGESGVMQCTGYDGDEMIAAYRPIPEAGWGLIVRQELTELYAPYWNNVFKFTLAALLVMALMMLAIYFGLEKFIKPITEMSDIARDMAGGDFSKRVKIKNNDEIGALGKALNTMAVELGQQFKMQKNRDKVLQSLVSSLDIRDMLTDSLTQICHAFDFTVGVVFLLDKDRQVLVPQATFNSGRELSTKNIKLGEGLEGQAAASGKAYVISDIPKDTDYTVNWLGGEMLPACIVQLPLIFNEQVLGVISAASMQQISEQQMKELTNVAGQISVAVNNALVYQQVVDLSEQLTERNEQLAQQNEELNALNEELTSQTEELNALNEELTSQTEELNALNEELIARTEELQLVSKELQAKNKQLETINRNKTNYLATLSHELRAPLNAVIGFSDVLLDKVLGDLNPQQEKYTREIFNSGQHLLNLINDLLDLSRIEAGEMRLDIKPTEPAAVAQQAVAMVQPDVIRKQIKLINNITPDIAQVWADSERLRQVFVNLLSNAVKYTPAGGQITLGAENLKDAVKFWVADTGIGIAPQYHEWIFEEFKQVNENTADQTGGAGLGLAITKKILNLQGGSIWVESEAGSGATFYFTLPNRPINALEEGSGHLPSEAIRYLKKPLDKSKLIAELKEHKQLPSKTTVLAVDDDPAVTEYISNILTGQGYQVITAPDGETGWKLALENEPDVIIIDIIMPKLNGFGLVEKLGKHNWQKKPQIFICSSYDLSAEQKQLLESMLKQ